MADYFINFSLTLPLKPEQREYALQLVKQAEAHRHKDQPLPADFPDELRDEVEGWTFETVADGEELWLHSQSGGQDAAGVFIQHLLKKFRFAPSVAFEWSHDCSQPRTDAYGGGAAYITRTAIKTMTTHTWLAQQSKRRNKEHVFSPDTHCCIKCGISAEDDAVENTPCSK